MAMRIMIFIFLFLTVVHVESQEYGLTERIPNNSLLISIENDTLDQINLRRVFPNISFNKTVYLTHAGDGTNRIFILQQTGYIWVFPNDDNVQEANEFLHVTNNFTDDGNEEGLLGLAFHPDYKNNGRFYIYYTALISDQLVTRLSEFKISNDINKADPGIN